MMQLFTDNNIKKLIKLTGYLLLIIGLVALYYGPLEIYCYYMFTDIGSLYSEHFNFGTLMFAMLVISNISYYLAALFLIPISIGLIKLRNWGRKLLINLIYICIISLASGLACFIFSVPQLKKDLNPVLMIFTIIASIMLISISLLFIKFINSKKMVSLFHKKKNLISKISPAELLVVTLNFLVIIVFHISILFKGLYPFFGNFLFFRQSVHFTAGSIFVLFILTNLFLKKNKVGFWGMIVYYSTLLISVILTFGRYTTSEIIQLLNYSQYEYDNVVSKISIVENINLTVLFSLLIATMIGLIMISRKKSNFK